MPNDDLIHPPAAANGPAPATRGEDVPAIPSEVYAYIDEDRDEGLDVRRYVFAILRYKWLLVLAVLVGGFGAYLVWTSTSGS